MKSWSEVLQGINSSPSGWTHVRDALDVLLLAFIVYRLLLAVRGTRGLQIAIGLGMVLALYEVANWLGMTAIHRVLDTLLTYTPLVVVILFQSEIRRLLAKASPTSLVRGRTVARELDAMESVIRGAFALAEKRIGAIIVFERTATLDEFVHQGCEVDARLTEELLQTVFVPAHDNPLHDGAVIVRDGKLWQAGVFLPLTGHYKLDRALGTRHRAAIGISEETDAIAVVVSEERGIVSLCFNGNIVRNVDPVSMRRLLTGMFNVNGKSVPSQPNKPARHSTPPMRSEAPSDDGTESNEDDVVGGGATVLAIKPAQDARDDAKGGAS